MKTSNVDVHGTKIEIDEKFVPGLVAGGVIYWCDEHEAYHLRDDHNEDRALRIVRMAAECDDMSAWADGMPVDPRDGETKLIQVLDEDALQERLVRLGMPEGEASYAAKRAKKDLLRRLSPNFTIGDVEFVELDNGHWGYRVFSTRKEFLMESMGALWEGEDLPNPTGRKIRYSELSGDGKF